MLFWFTFFFENIYFWFIFAGEVVEKLIFFCQRRRIEEDIPFLFFFSVACFGDSVKKKVEYQVCFFCKELYSFYFNFFLLGF